MTVSKPTRLRINHTLNAAGFKDKDEFQAIQAKVIALFEHGWLDCQMIYGATRERILAMVSAYEGHLPK